MELGPSRCNSNSADTFDATIMPRLHYSSSLVIHSQLGCIQVFFCFRYCIVCVSFFFLGFAPILVNRKKTGTRSKWIGLITILGWAP